MTDLFFVDTNVLVYNRDSSLPEKQTKAQAWLQRLWTERSGVVSYQVLSEFYVTVTRKLKVETQLVRDDVHRLLAWSPIPVDDRVLHAAWNLEERYSLSWWDALIVGAAKVRGCRRVLTEDLQEGQNLDGVLVVNPFHTAP